MYRLQKGEFGRSLRSANQFTTAQEVNHLVSFDLLEIPVTLVV